MPSFKVLWQKSKSENLKILEQPNHHFFLKSKLYDFNNSNEKAGKTESVKTMWLLWLDIGKTFAVINLNSIKTMDSKLRTNDGTTVLRRSRRVTFDKSKVELKLTVLPLSTSSWLKKPSAHWHEEEKNVNTID